MSGPAQGARRTREQVLAACLVVALPALLAGASAGESQTLPTCNIEVLPPSAPGTLVPDELPAANAERGFAVAMGIETLSGVSLAAVGARFDGPAGGGAVYLFQWTGRAWEERFSCASTQPGEQFGFAVALHGDMLAVGAPGQQRGQGPMAGAFYLFTLDFVRSGLDHRATPRVERIEKIASPLAGVANQGRAVALDDTHLAVSATMSSAGGPLGAVLVYSLPLTPESLPTVLMPAVPQPDRFGAALALSGGTLIAGAPGRTGLAGQAAAGAVYLFPLAAGGQPVGELRPVQETADAQFGSALSASGSSLAVGAVGAGATLGPPAGGPGAVFVFTGGNSTWTQQAMLVPDLARRAVGEQFGQAVAIDGDLLVAGAPLSGVAAFAGGAAFLFQFQPRSGAWTTVPTAIVDGDTPHGLFGSAVALLGDLAVVAAPLANQGKGAVSAFSGLGPDGGTAPRSSGVPAAPSIGGGGGGGVRRPAAAPGRNAGAAPP